MSEPLKCTQCDKPLAQSHHWEPEYEKQHGNGNGCECAECIAICWGGCVLAGKSIDWRSRCLTAESRLATAEAVVQAVVRYRDVLRTLRVVVWATDLQREACGEIVAALDADPAGGGK
jgi:hypothetical protein